MATERVGVYRKYHGPVPTNAAGNPLPKSEWPSKRPCCWVARWFGTNGNRYSRSFETRKETLCRRAGVGKFTIHDLRRSCITNWASKLPIHVTQQYAGHSDINTTRKFYLSVQECDAKTARRMQKKLLGELKGGDPTDPKLTPRARKRDFPRRKQFKPLTEVDEL